MEDQIFSVWDCAADRYLEPFFAPTIDFALRGFKEAVNKNGHQFNKFPQDFTLFHIGKFNPASGDIHTLSPRSLGVAITFLESEFTDA